jgi:hypothetical protein
MSEIRRRGNGARHERHESGGQHLHRLAHQWHVLAVREFRTDAQADDLLGQADAVDVDVVAVGELIRAEFAEPLEIRGRRGGAIDDAVRAA